MEFFKNLTKEKLGELSTFVAMNGFDMMLEYLEECRLTHLRNIVTTKREELGALQDTLRAMDNVISQLRTFRIDVGKNDQSKKTIKRI